MKKGRRGNKSTQLSCKIYLTARHNKSNDIFGGRKLGRRNLYIVPCSISPLKISTQTSHCDFHKFHPTNFNQIIFVLIRKTEGFPSFLQEGVIMKNKILIILSIISIFLSSCTKEKPVEEKLQNVLDKGIAKYDIHGVSASVIFPDGEIWNGVSGISHNEVPMDPNMLFAIGSVTKNFIATLTLKLVEDEVLSLEDPLSKWLPSYHFIDSQITIRQLLNHTSGIYNYFDNQKIWDELMSDRTRYWTPEEVLEYLEEPYFDAGEGFRYSNTNYLLAGMIINKATGSNLSTELNNRLFKPLGFSDYYLIQEQTLPENQAHVYSDNWDGPVRDVTFLPRTSHDSIGYGAGGLFTTSENLARWSQSLFEGKILQEQSLDEMLNFIQFTPVANMRAYGLGVQEFMLKASSGVYAIGHGGGNIGTTTYMVYIPEHHVSIVVMINAYPNEGADEIMKGLIRVALIDLQVYGVLNFIKAYSVYFTLAALAIIYWSIFWIIRRKRKKRKSSNSQIL